MRSALLSSNVNKLSRIVFFLSGTYLDTLYFTYFFCYSHFYVSLIGVVHNFAFVINLLLIWTVSTKKIAISKNSRFDHFNNLDGKVSYLFRSIDFDR